MTTAACPRFATLALAIFVGGSASASQGTIAGKVYGAGSPDALAGVTVNAFSITTEQGFSVVTDATGSYVVPDAPSGVYAFVLRTGGVDYPVRERLDVRVTMPFILESCFLLDREKLTASVRTECRSGLVEEARVASVGNLRFLLPRQEPVAAADVLDAPTLIEHEGIECLVRDHHPMVDADIRPGDMVQTSRVYFRSDKYPDFYYVEMTAEHPTVDDFQAILPKPGPETERVIYYVESIDTGFDNLQTPEFDPEVLETDECERRGGGAWFVGDPSIILGATTPGAAAIPPGFQAVGITGFVNSLGVLSSVGGGTAGGAVASTTGILVVSGGAAAAAGAVVIATEETEASPP